MSIQVTNNGDGTLTVTCGAESMTVVTVTTNPGQGSTADQDDRPPVTAGGGGVTANLVKWPLVTIGGGGMTASLVQTLGHGVEVDHKVVGSQGEMVEWLESLGDSQSPRFAARGERRALHIELRGDQPLDLAPISQIWRTGLNERYTFCEVHLTDKDG